MYPVQNGDFLITVLLYRQLLLMNLMAFILFVVGLFIFVQYYDLYKLCPSKQNRRL